jgi:hypothetical protein
MTNRRSRKLNELKKMSYKNFVDFHPVDWYLRTNYRPLIWIFFIWQYNLSIFKRIIAIKGSRIMKKFFFFVLLIAISLIMGARDNSSAVPDSGGRIIWQFYTDKEYRGPVQRGVVDPESQVTYLATMGTLYEVRNGKIKAIAQRSEKEARFALAPGGKIYGWLLPQTKGQRFFYTTLFDISGNKIGELRPKDFPYGFSAFYMGFQGKMIVTSSPLDDREGIRGRFQFNFWNQKGEVLKKVIIDGRQIGVLDSTGEAILLLGEREARVLSSSGKEMWQLSGKYRKATISRGGKLALLNPSSLKEINQIIVHDGKTKRKIVNIPTPVHGITLSPDDSSAAVVGDKGRTFFLDVSTGEFKEGSRLAFEGTFYITNQRFLDANTLAIGILHREGGASKGTWPKGTILIIDRNGKEIFRKELSIRKATAFDPKIEVTLGSRFVIGYTEETTILIELER